MAPLTYHYFQLCVLISAAQWGRLYLTNMCYLQTCARPLRLPGAVLGPGCTAEKSIVEKSLCCPEPLNSAGGCFMTSVLSGESQNYSVAKWGDNWSDIATLTVFRWRCLHTLMPAFLIWGVDQFFYDDCLALTEQSGLSVRFGSWDLADCPSHSRKYDPLCLEVLRFCGKSVFSCVVYNSHTFQS